MGEGKNNWNLVFLNLLKVKNQLVQMVPGHSVKKKEKSPGFSVLSSPLLTS
jgi:hypothetical protein